jgi:hypothetical protein
MTIRAALLLALAPAAFAQSADPYPYQSVAYFQSACPQGWSVFTEATGRFIAGITANTKVGTAFPATPINGVADISHTHTATISVTPTEQQFEALAGKGITLASDAALSATANMSVANSGLGIVGLLTCVKVTQPNTTSGIVPPGVVIFSAALACDAGWNEVFSAAGRYIVSLPANGQVAAAYGGQPFTANQEITHSHAVSGNVKLSTRKTSAISGCCTGGFAKNGTYAYNTTSSAPTSTTPPYILLHLCQKGN